MRISPGRAASAPTLRSAPGQRAEGNLLLAEAQEEIEYDGMRYPGVLYEGEWQPGARSHRQDRLPHQHDELHSLFPRAIALSEEEEESEEETDMLEARGLREGGHGAGVGGLGPPHMAAQGDMVGLLLLGHEKVPTFLSSHLGLDANYDFNSYSHLLTDCHLLSVIRTR